MMKIRKGEVLTIKGKKILVTGGAGFIGSHIVEALIKEKAGQIVVFDNFIRGTKANLKEALKSKKVTIITGDVTKPAQINRAMQGVDYVFHEVALWLLDCEKKPRQALEININGTFNVLEACVKNKVKKIIAASSASVYGDGLYFPTDEKHPFNHYLFYGASKVADEQLLKVFYKKYGLDYIALRYFNAYGTRQEHSAAYTSVIMKFIKKLAQNEPPVIFGDGSATMDLVYVTDIAKANLKALKAPVTNEVFNVCSGKETSLKNLLKILIELMRVKKLQPIFKPYDKQLVSRRLGSTKKAQKMLDFKTEITVAEGVKKVLNWMQKDNIIATLDEDLV